jgi:hypothetical protein
VPALVSTVCTIFKNLFVLAYYAYLSSYQPIPIYLGNAVLGEKALVFMGAFL